MRGRMWKSGLFRGWLLCLALVGGGLAAGGLPGSWREVCRCRRGEGNLEFESVWDGDGPLALGFRLEADRREFLLELGPDRTRFHSVPAVGLERRRWTAVRETGWRPGRGITLRMPVLVKFREEHWLFYLQDRLVAWIPAPGETPLRVLVPPEQEGRVRNGFRFRAVPRVRYDTDFMIEEGAGGDLLYPWIPAAGKWGLHTALAEALKRPETNQGMTKSRPLTADKSPNFYSLKGTGREARILTGYDFYDGFRYDAALQAAKGEGGLLFYARGEGAAFSCHGWTLSSGGDDALPGRLRLWRLRNGRREPLRTFELPVFQRQWYRLSVRLVDDRILGYLDDVPIMEHREPVPPGGRIGLFADTDGECRFDDVHLRGAGQQILRSADDLRFETLRRTGGFRIEGGTLRGAARSRDEMFLLGRPHQRPGVFSVRVAPRGNSWALGVVGACSGGEPGRHYRMELRRGGSGGEARLYSVRGDRKELLERAPWEPADAGGSFSLGVDGSEPGRLRFLCEDRLVFLVRGTEGFSGASGVWLGAGSQADFSGFGLDRERRGFVEQKQKNPVFRKDSFMRHWASPEGQWIGDAQKRIWHKGDFLGDFVLQMPWIDKSRLHLGIPDGAADGALQVAVQGRELTLAVREPEDPEPAVLKAALPEGMEPEKTEYRVCHEGYLLWLEAGGKTLLIHRLRRPLRRLGTRARVEGMGIAQLARSQAYRRNVIDEFFYESPHAWQQDGGEWLIINRFQCTPSWSHMIGENNGGLAALWRKQVFRGDLTLEFYAGTRHEHYHQAGNLNCTLFARTASPSSGYTATATEWDQNQSQNWSRLYKDGRMLAQSDRYLVPRRRNDMYRRILNPLISSGRPIHGAWFYIKVRKTGNRLEYYFDDELIHTVRDTGPVPEEGLVGIWTFMHSMTLAQIKITFDHVRPRPVRFREVPAGSPAPRPPPAPSGPGFQGTIGGARVDPLRLDGWRLSGNRVGCCRLLPLTGNASGIRFENQLGGGDMRLDPGPTAPLELKRLAGWKFNLRLENQARINFLYDVVDAQGKPVRHCYQQLNAGDFTRGAVHWMGRTALDRSAAGARGQEVFVGIPHRLRRDHEGCRIVFRGFGGEQEDFQDSGLHGNPPGAAYEVREFRPVFFEIPEFVFQEDYRFHCRRKGEIRFPTRELAAGQLAERCRAYERDGWNDLEILVRKNRRRQKPASGQASGPGPGGRVEVLRQPVSWIHLPARIGYELLPSPEFDGALLLRGRESWPDRRCAFLRILRDGKELPYRWEEGRRPPDFRLEQRHALVRVPDIEGRVAVTVAYGGRTIGEHVFSAGGRLRVGGPVLAELNGFTPFFYPGAAGRGRPAPVAALAVRNYLDGDSGKEALLVRQRSAGSRLRVGFKRPFPLARFPVLQFDYRCDDLANVSLLSGKCRIRLTEQDGAGCARVRRGSDLRLDGAWHRWLGTCSDGLTGRYEDAAQFQWASGSRHPQTGRYSWICLADIVFGPAVREASQLYCRPVYQANGGMDSVGFLLLGDPLPGKEALAKAAWRTVRPGEEIRPSLGQLKDGDNWLCLRGVDRAGRSSEVSALPFVLDRRKLAVSAAVVPTDDVRYNGCLLQFSLDNHGLSSWEYGRARLTRRDAALALAPCDNEFLHDSRTDRLRVNHARLLKDELDRSRDGDVLRLTLQDVYDGAGNRSDDFAFDCRVRYAEDRTAPQWSALAPGPGVVFGKNWNGTDTSPGLEGRDNSWVRVEKRKGGDHHLVSYAYYGRNRCGLKLDWNPAGQAVLAFRAMLPVHRDAMRIQLWLDTNKDRRLLVSLKKPAKGRNQLNRTETFAWKDAQWQAFRIPVGEWLRNLKLSDQERKDLKVTSLVFACQGTRYGEAFHLDDLYILAPEDSPGVGAFSWDAFDASGVKGIECTPDSPAGDKTTGAPKTFPPGEKINVPELRKAAPPGAHWLLARLVDKAGNKSQPAWIPLR